MKYVICYFSPFFCSFLENPLFFVTPFVLYFFFCCLFAVVNCTDPGHLENSIRQVQPSGPHRFSFGTTVSYQCSHGYYLLGTHVLTCQGDGTWDRALPQCLCKSFRIIPIHHRFTSHIVLCCLAERSCEKSGSKALCKPRELFRQPHWPLDPAHRRKIGGLRREIPLEMVSLRRGRQLPLGFTGSTQLQQKYCRWRRAAELLQDRSS